MKGIKMVIMTVTALLTLSPFIASAYAACGTGNASDSWTPRTGVTFSISATACPGSRPHHTLSSSRTDTTLIPQNSNYTFRDDDRVYPNTGNRVLQSFSTGLGTLPSADQAFGPFSGDAIPNCGYTDFYILVKDSVTNATHVLTAEAFGVTTGSCPV